MVNAVPRPSAPWESPPISWLTPTQRESWRGATQKHRSTWNKRSFIDHPSARVPFEDAWSHAAYCALFNQSFTMLIMGEAGSGKTTLSKEFERQVNAHYGRVDPEKTIMSALRLEKLPRPCNPNEICWAILRALGDPNPKKRDKSTLKEQTADMLTQCEVRVVLLDNIQDVPMARGEKGIEQVGSAFRDLIDATTLLWIFLGTKEANRVIDSDKQLIKRVKYRAKLPYFSTEDLADKKMFLRLLVRFDEWLPLAESSAPMLRQYSGLIHIGTEGVMERISDLLGFACLFAARDGREHLLLQDLDSAFSLLMGRDHESPFRPDFKLRRLDRPDEPFAIMKAIRKSNNGAGQPR